MLVVPAIAVCGLFALYSASSGGGYGSAAVRGQLAAFVIGFGLAAVALALDDHVLPRISGWLYWLNVLMLLAVDVLGRESHGAQRWLTVGPISLQPSEPAKVALIITLSVMYLRHYDEIQDFRTVLKSLAHMGLPLVLIFKQPDLGTTAVILAIWLGISLAAGVRWKQIMLLIGCAVVAFAIAWNTGILRDYQKQRLTSFLNPDADPRGSGYHIRQSKIAIGSGQVLGKGYTEGTQSQLDFIPEQNTDFIFTIVGEETGFVGSVVVVGLYWLLVARVSAAMQSTEERLGRMIAGGVLAMLLFHVFVNIGMTLGIMPVTGVPLPLFSYGRSNLLTTMIAVGLVQGVFTRRHRIAF